MNKELVNTLTKRISIVEEVATQSTSGAPSATKTDRVLKTCRASQNEVSVTEDDADGKIRALFTTYFIIRYDKDLTKGRANSFLVIDDEDFRYNIVQVVPKIDKRYLQINCIRRE